MGLGRLEKEKGVIVERKEQFLRLQWKENKAEQWTAVDKQRKEGKGCKGESEKQRGMFPSFTHHLFFGKYKKVKKMLRKKRGKNEGKGGSG